MMALECSRVEPEAGSYKCSLSFSRSQAQATASGPGNNPAAGHPGQNIVGEFDLTSDFQATGSFSFGTGSLVAIEIIIPGGSSSPGNSNVTTIFEYDQFNEYFTGSGN